MPTRPDKTVKSKVVFTFPKWHTAHIAADFYSGVKMIYVEAIITLILWAAFLIVLFYSGGKIRGRAIFCL